MGTAMTSGATLKGLQCELDLALPAERGASLDEQPALSPIRVAGRLLHPTPVFDTYWQFAARRHAVYQARLEGRPGPWTDDPILLRHRFTNCYRAADRVSQFLIRHVSYTGAQDMPEVVFRTLLFKMFNRVSTWELLSGEIGEISWKDFSRSAYDDVLTRAFAAGRKLYSAAYVIPPPRLGADRKHSNHLRLLELMMTTDVGDASRAAGHCARPSRCCGHIRRWVTSSPISSPST